jgi:hypothetical protein
MNAKLSLALLLAATGGVFAQSPGEPKLNTAAAKAFTGKVQAVLSNVCADCHAHPKHTSPFKLKPHDPAFNDPPTADANLRAVTPYLDTARPYDSKLLKYAATAHGKATDPPLKAGHPALTTLELWVHWASGPEGSAAPTAVPPPPVDTKVVQAGATQPPAEPAKLPPMKAVPVPSFAGMKAKVDPIKGNPDDPFDPAGFNKK